MYHLNKLSVYITVLAMGTVLCSRSLELVHLAWLKLYTH